MPAKRAAASLISRGDPAPLHYQVRRLLLEEIDRGVLAPGQKLAPEREYAARFGISLAPVRQAILGLVEEDYLYRVRGSGTFVREAKVEEKIAILSSFTESMRARGFEPDIRTVEQRVVESPIRVRQAIGARQVLSLWRVALVDGKPVAVLAAYLPADRVPGLVDVSLEGGSLYSLLAERYAIHMARAQSWIEVGRCRPADAALLGVRAGTPTLFVEGITYDTSDRPVEFSRVMYRADRFRFGIESFRRDDHVLHLIGAPTNEEGRPK
ncbi:MAG: GntR family transcriptional regulator [Candidatus Dormibacteraceae bacterium]